MKLEKVYKVTFMNYTSALRDTVQIGTEILVI